MNTRTYTAPVFEHVVIASALAQDKRPTARARAIAANDAEGTDASVLARYGALKYVPADDAKVDRFGPIDARTGSEPRMRRWLMALRSTWTVFAMPEGSVYVPCYVCGDTFDAWSMDSEHLDPFGGSHPGNLLLACAECNLGKSDTHVPHHDSVQYVLDMTAGMSVPRGSTFGKKMFRARHRRPDGADMASRRPGQPVPAGWLAPLD